MLLLLTLAWKLNVVLKLVYVSALFAVVLMPVVRHIMKLKVRGWRPSRPVAIVALILGAAALLALFLILGLPPVVRDIQHFAEDLPGRIPAMVAKMKHLPMADKLGVDSIASKAQGLAASAAQYLFSSAPLWISHLLDIVTTFILCLYFMLEGDEAYAYCLSLVPVGSRERLAHTLGVAEVKMSKWLLGQGSLMLILGVASTIAFGLLHVRYFVLLGVLMGLFNIIPVAGGIITILLAGGVAGIDSWQKMVGVFLFYAIYIQVENGYLTPKIMKSSVDLMGLTVLIALLAGTALAGVVGALVAVPTAALITVFMDEYLVQKKDTRHPPPHSDLAPPRFYSLFPAPYSLALVTCPQAAPVSQDMQLALDAVMTRIPSGSLPASPTTPATKPVSQTAAERKIAELQDIDFLVRTYRPRLLRFVAYSIGDADLAESIATDCLLKAYNSRDKFRGDCSVNTWLTSIAVNLVRDQQRLQKFRSWRQARATAIDVTDAASFLPSNESSPESRLLTAERARQVQTALETLSPNQRTVFLMRFTEELDLSEIAAALKMPVNTVKTHLHRALKSVRAQVGLLATGGAA